MAPHVKTAKVKLVIVIAPFELEDHIAKDLKALGVNGFTTMRANGTGAHGPRRYGPVDGANTRFEVLAPAERASTILAHVVAAFDGQAVLAYSIDAEAVPERHFE